MATEAGEIVCIRMSKYDELRRSKKQKCEHELWLWKRGILSTGMNKYDYVW